MSWIFRTGTPEKRDRDLAVRRLVLLAEQAAMEFSKSNPAFSGSLKKAVSRVAIMEGIE